MGVWTTLASLVVLGLVVMFLIQRFLGRPWWSRFWRRMSRKFDPLRQIHWTLAPVAVTGGLFAYMVIAAATRTGGWVVGLWWILAGYSSWSFGKQRVLGRHQRRRLTKAAADGIGLPVSIRAASSRFSLLDRWANAVALLPYSVLLLGATRSGKTEAAKHIVQQMLNRFGDGVMVVFDYKTDYQDFFDALGIDYIRLSLRDSTHVLNLFDEFADELDVDEFARAMFPDGGGRRDGGSAEHFEDVARQTFAAVLKMLRRERDDLSTATVRNYFEQSSAEEIHNDLTAHNDLRAAQSALNTENNAKHAQNTYITLQKRVSEVFVGDFGRAPEDGERSFSFRDAYENPPRKPIVLDFPKDKGASTAPLFRFYLDWAARFALDDSRRQDYFILDEFARIPHLRKIGDLLNVGAGDRVQVVVALQSVSQMYANYGRDNGEALLSGLVTKILLRANDSETVDFIRESIGTEFVEYTQHVEKRYSPLQEREVEVDRETKEEEEHVFAKGDVRKWDPGVGAVVLPNKWAFGYIPQLNAGLADLYALAISGDESEAELESTSSSDQLEKVVTND